MNFLATVNEFGGFKFGSAFFGWLTATGTAVLLPVWDVDYTDERGAERQLRAAGRLRGEATWTIDMPGSGMSTVRLTRPSLPTRTY